MGRPPSVSSETTSIVRSDLDSVRRAFRVPVPPGNGIKVVLNEREYNVIDISPQGLSIRCKDSTAFTVAQVIEDCRLIMPGLEIRDLTARVIHSSCKSGSEWTNGIQWVGLTETAQENIAEQVSGIKRLLIEATRDLPDSEPPPD